jgi:hypothetical protein
MFFDEVNYVIKICQNQYHYRLFVHSLFALGEFCHGFEWKYLVVESVKTACHTAFATIKPLVQAF